MPGNRKLKPGNRVIAFNAYVRQNGKYMHYVIDVIPCTIVDLAHEAIRYGTDDIAIAIAQELMQSTDRPIALTRTYGNDGIKIDFQADRDIHPSIDAQVRDREWTSYFYGGSIEHLSFDRDIAKFAARFLQTIRKSDFDRYGACTIANIQSALIDSGAIPAREIRYNDAFTRYMLPDWYQKEFPSQIPADNDPERKDMHQANQAIGA
jgi:hypothetical protein